MNFKSFGFREIRVGLQIVQLYIAYISRYRITPHPIVLHWILTYSCNCKCSYCGRGNFKSERNILNQNQAFSLVNQAKELGVKYIAFTGGEPLLHDFYPELFSYARNRGLGTILNTNGLLISKENCKFLSENFDYIVVSVDTLDSKEFDQLRGVENGLDTVMNSISLLSEYMPGENLLVNILVNGRNIKNITSMIRHFSNEGIPVLMQPLHESNEAKLLIKDKSLLNISCIEDVWEEVLDTIEHTDPIRKPVIRKYYQDFPLFFFNRHKLIKSFTCFAGSFSFFVNPYGDVFACEEKPKVAGNICESSLKDIWIKMRDIRSQISSKERNCICWYQCSALNSLFLTQIFNNPVRILLKMI